MDKLKKSRTPLRTLATRTCNEVDVLLALEVTNHELLVGKFTKLTDLWEKIHPIDNQILDLLIDLDDPQAYEDEVMANDKYYDEITLSKIRIDNRIKKDEKENQPPIPPSNHSSIETDNAKKRKFKLPKIELAKFSGKLLDWLSWWSQFEKIHKDDELHDTDKFEYLKQSMVDHTRVKEMSIKDVSQEMAINSYDIVSTLQALGMMKYWKGKHIILKKQDVLEEYAERVKRRGAVVKIDPAHLRWTPFVPPPSTSS